ncbi:hypothetical protein PC113_g14531 [Phytophthora cactorum]|uniref:Uncharacterized protein n=1 Tax=Phytophthora cactorum TaxID=29920 RepID=A0A8T0YQE3_9STRA|nr:hypothetical protein PC113_g14531 [Phytophthora cactorum]
MPSVLVVLLLLLLLLLLSAGAFRVINSSTDSVIGTHAVFEPYEAGYVGYYGDPSNPSAERLNEGSPYSPDTPRIFFSAPLQQSCPGMLGPGHNGEFYCFSREYGNCDRRSGLCVCNQGYTGLDCTACQPGYFKRGGLCFAKKSCPNDCSRGGECDYATGTCTCAPTRRGVDCSQKFCAFDEKCVSCTSTVCLQCVEKFYVDPTTQTCVSCARYDPRCLSCNSHMCLTCADLQLNSVRRSGARRIDQPLPEDERLREFSQKFVYGSQDPRVFDEAESFTLAPAAYSSLPLNESSVGCTQGGNADAGWTCSSFAESHRVCGHRGVFSFVSPLYAIAEAAGSITVTVQRSGGGLGRAALLYDLEHVTTTPGDVSPSMFYTSSQRLDFFPGVVSLAFKLQIHDDHVLGSSKTFRLRLREPFVPSDLLSVAPATLGNQWRTLVTILDDDALRPVANCSYVVRPESTLLKGGAAGDQMTFQIQSVLGNGVPGVDPPGEAVFLMTSYIEEEDYSTETAVFRTLRRGTVTQSGGVSVSLLTCTWVRERAGNFSVAVQLLYPGGLRGEYFGDAWLGEHFLELKATCLATMEIIPAQQLFSGSHIQDSPFTNVVVTPALTAGETFAFSVLPRDAYGNRRRSRDQHGTQRDDIAASLTLISDRSLGGKGTQAEDALVSWDGELDVFRVLARPQRTGDYSMIVSINSVDLAASPFTVVVVPAQLNAAQCVISGSGILAGRVADQVATAVLETRDLYANRIYTGGISDLKLQASLLTSTVPTVATGQIVDNADGTYKFTYIPRVAGSYSVSITWNGVHLHNSPYAITAVPNTPKGQTSIAQGPGITSAKTNVQTTFKVTTRDSSGNDVLTGGVASALTVVLELPGKNNVSGNACTDLLNGHYTCTYTAHYVGITRLHVTLSNQATRGSPFLVNVTAGPALGSRCVASGAALVSVVAGERTNFIVSIYDTFGNAKANAGSESIAVTFTGPGAVATTVNAAVAVKYTGNGVFLVTYTLSLKGSYKVSVAVDGVAVASSPFTMYAYPALASPTTTSLDLLSPAFPKTQVDPPLVFLAGALIVSRLTTRDTLGNVLETGGSLFQLDDPVRAFLDAPITDEKNGSYLVSLRPKRSVQFPFTPNLMMPGGVNGSYYSASAVPVGPATAESSPDYSLMVLKRRDATISFDFGEKPPSQMHSAETFSVRWDGFLLPRFSEVYTFEVDVLGFASLQISSTSVAVHKGSTNAFMKVALIAQTFVDLELNFSKPRAIANATVSLWWSSLSQPREIIPSSQLFTSWRIVNNVPPLDIKPAAADPSTFTPEFGISSLIPESTTVRAVVDESFIFTVVARDSFSNKVGGEDYCTLYGLLPQVPSGSSQPGLSVTDLLDGSYKVNLVPHLAGNFSLYIAALPDAKKTNAPTGGDALVAFLSPYNIKGSPFKLQVDPGLPSAVTSTLIGGGFVSTTAGVFTSFVLELRDGSVNRLTAFMVTSYLDQVRVKLRSMSTSAEVSAKVSQMNKGGQNVLSAQEVLVEYTVTLAGLHAVLLSVDGGKSFTQKTATLRVFPNVATAATSFVSPNGAGVTATGAGLGPQIFTKQDYTYHVTVRDAFGNIRDSGGDLLVARIHGPDSSAGNVTDLGKGDYVVTYRVVLPGAYEIETRVAEPQRGLTGYYYVDTASLQRNLASAVRAVDAVIDFDWRKNVSMRSYPRVVWQGFLRPSFTEEYTLWVKILSDVGSAAGVYIDGKTVINGLNTATTSGRVMLVGGRLHAIVVEYRSASLQQDPGYLSLLWQSVRQLSQLIPTQSLIAEASEILPRRQLVAVN